MADLRVRNLNDHIAEAVKSQAKHHGRSVEAELREMITESIMAPKRKMAERLRAFREEIGITPDSTPYIRAMRDGNDE